MARSGWCQAEPVLFLTSCLLWQFKGYTLRADTRADVERIRWTLFHDTLTQSLVKQLLPLLTPYSGLGSDLSVRVSAADMAER
jgi:hypothetical protein